MDFVSELVRKRGKENLQKFIQYVVDILKRYKNLSFLNCLCYPVVILFTVAVMILPLPGMMRPQWNSNLIGRKTEPFWL